MKLWTHESGKQAIVIVLILGEYLSNFMYALRTFVHQIVYKIGIINDVREQFEILAEFRWHSGLLVKMC